MANKFMPKQEVKTNKFVNAVNEEANNNNWGEVVSVGDKLYLHIVGIKMSGEFAEKLRNSTKEILNKKLYLLSEANVYSETPLEMLPDALISDLIRAKKAGLNKVYELKPISSNGEWYLKLKAVPPMFFGGGSFKKERKLGDEQIAYIGVNSKNSQVGVIVPAKRKRG